MNNLIYFLFCLFFYYNKTIIISNQKPKISIEIWHSDLRNKTKNSFISSNFEIKNKIIFTFLFKKYNFNYIEHSKKPYKEE